MHGQTDTGHILHIYVGLAQACPEYTVCSLVSWPSHPAFVACSTNTGEGLVKLSHMVWRTWTCGGVLHSYKNGK